jgi:predicted TIM-barrel fold metal-dependent hydrolase
MLISAHEHIDWPASGRADDPDWAHDCALIEAADLLGIATMACSCLAPRPSNPVTFRVANDRMAAAIARFPGRVWGYAYVNPGYPREAIAEIDRCLAIEDMIGVKLYNEYRATDPAVLPVVEHCLALGAPILWHQGHCTDELAAQPNISDAADLAWLANRYPELKLILGHIGGGGDWEWTIKQAAEAPTLYADLSGSVVDEGLVEMAVEYLGADRLLFACDGSMCAGVGKLLGAQISDADRRKIESETFLRLLGRSAPC